MKISMTRNTRNRALSIAARLVCGLGVAPALAGAAVLLPSAVLAQSSADAPDTLILRNGRILKGKVLEETDMRVNFLLVSGGIKAPAWYERTDILKVERGAAAPEKPAGDPVFIDKPKTDPVKREAGADAKKVYVVELKGEFGTDFSQTPIREAIKDAKRHSPDYIIVVLDNDWSDGGKGDDRAQLADDTAASGEAGRAEDICRIFANEIPDQWETDGGQGQPPKMVFWIKQAMGGSAVLPLACDTIYFSSGGRLGGLGDLSLRLGSRGDEVTRQKLYSAYMSSVESWAVKGGYDYRLIRAICRFEYVLSYKWEGGKAVYIEQMPENPGEILLTDDGDDQAGRRDTIQERVRGTGNDVLTLSADLAERLDFSKGTVDTLEDLIFSLGIARNSTVVDGRSERIMEAWPRAVSDAKRDLRRLWNDFQDVQVGGDYAERARGRGQQMSKIREMLGIIKRYGESLDGAFYQQYGLPDEQWLKDRLKQIELEQQLDKR